MPELRLNLITREWVIVQSERAKKPEEFRQRREKRYQPEFLDECPFCPGNEQKTPDEIMRLNDGGWKVRVIPNKLAVLSPDGEVGKRGKGFRNMVTGVGRHEVIIENPRHNMHLAISTVDEIRDILGVYKARFTEIYRDPRIEHVIIFKNHGAGSGTTLMHPHSQIIGTPVVPIQVRDRVEEAMRYFDHSGECLMCAMLKDEIADGRRVIRETERFVSFIPYAALSAFHMWIFPKRHMATFAEISDEEAADLAANIKGTLAMLYHGLEDPDYNYVIRSESPAEYRSDYFHWYISIVPRLGQASGFELGSGMFINQSIPEEVADYLKKVKVP